MFGFVFVWFFFCFWSGDQNNMAELCNAMAKYCGVL